MRNNSKTKHVQKKIIIVSNNKNYNYDSNNKNLNGGQNHRLENKLWFE